MTADVAFLLCGLALLMAGGELLVRAAVRIAERLGLSPMLVGLTIVGMGTSTPELAASVQAGLAGSPGIAVGNIVGSNLANLLLILGFAALLAPIPVARGVLWRDGGVGVLSALALAVAGASIGLNRLTGAALLAAMAAYIFYAYRQESAGGTHGAAFDRAAAVERADPALASGRPSGGSIFPLLLMFLSGLMLIVGGGRLLVQGAIAIAAQLGVTDEVIGLTIVAVGTSLPELVTSAVAAFRRQGDIVLGNVLGSNVYNILFIGGVTGLLAPGEVPASILAFDLWLLIGAALLATLFALTGGRLSRREGLALVSCYALYSAATGGIL